MSSPSPIKTMNVRKAREKLRLKGIFVNVRRDERGLRDGNWVFLGSKSVETRNASGELDRGVRLGWTDLSVLEMHHRLHGSLPKLSRREMMRHLKKTLNLKQDDSK